MQACRKLTFDAFLGFGRKLPGEDRRHRRRRMVNMINKVIRHPAPRVSTKDNAEYSIGAARVRKLGEGSNTPMAGTTDRMR
jgi:hypothetical protein